MKKMTREDLNFLFFLNCTDAGNAERVARLIGENWRFIWQGRYWLRWNGKKWEKVSELALIKPLITCIRYLKALKFTEEERKYNPNIDKIKKFLLSSENASRVSGCIRLLESELAADIEQFDNKEYLINLNDVTLDLRTGETHEHAREDFLTQISPANYNGCSSDLWLKTIAEVLPDEPTRRYFQKYCGYCLSGSTEAEKFIVMYGDGGGGKGTVMETIAACMGKDYTVTLSVNALLAGQRISDGSAHNSEIAKLKGKRVVLSSETSKGCKFDDAKIKHLTGSDTVTARMPHGMPFEYKPQFKLTIQTNFLPAIEDVYDKGMRRRLVIVPFDSQFKERNEKLKNELKSELDGCMQWLLKGWKMYQEEGLADFDSDKFPEKIKAAMKDFYTQNDTFSDFIAECFITDKDAAVRSNVAFDIYKRWAAGDRSAVGRKSFFAELRKRGFARVHKINGDYIEGLLEKTCTKI